MRAACVLACARQKASLRSLRNSQLYSPTRTAESTHLSSFNHSWVTDHWGSILIIGTNFTLFAVRRKCQLGCVRTILPTRPHWGPEVARSELHNGGQVSSLATMTSEGLRISEPCLCLRKIKVLCCFDL